VHESIRNDLERIIASKISSALPRTRTLPDPAGTSRLRHGESRRLFDHIVCATVQKVDRSAAFKLVSTNKNKVGGRLLNGRFKLKRDYYAGGLMLLLGVGAAVTGSGYKFGSLARMGPGFLPVMLGIVLAFLGILIAGTALGSSEPDDNKFLPDNPQWFGWLCILGGPVLFIILGHYGGMIPAVFACVFVCALGDKTATYKSSTILAAGVTVFGVLLFHYLLTIPFPLLRGFNL
jgi:Tripartite tricarboxylate transporter TctB family